ncbi:hypothetical protein [uncultured Dokdonia sp.]|uniref:hypothetical protein n=1 Tax=Dokdonia sp. R78006 TaxID=3093866 RepID=UPI00262389BA|nr:hypothetical protein [uncultured Dokdonia sp.]
MTTSQKPSTLFWVIAIVLLLWNFMGASAFIVDNFFTDALAGTYNEEQMAAINATPIWSKILYGISTIGGLLAAILLITRKTKAVQVYAISLIAVIIHTVYNIGFAGAMELFGVGEGVIFPLIIIVLAIFEYWWSRYSASKGWLK